MRTYFSTALAFAVATAQQANYDSFAPGSPLMAVERLGEGLDMARAHEVAYGHTELDHGVTYRVPAHVEHPSRY